MKNLWAGPMVGEFGWSLFCWQGILRHMAKKYNKVYVAGRPGHDVIYEDFAEYIPLDGIGDETSGMRNRDYIYNNEHENYPVHDVILPETYLTHYNPRNENNSRFLNTKQEFIKYGKAKYQVEILIHARETSKWGSGYRNWNRQKWDKLTEKLKGHKLTAIGKSSQVYIPKGCMDYTDINLRSLTNVMASAKLIIGPSSGPMHLAALCDLPRVTWGIPELEKTYKYHWNPFKVSVNYICSKNWDPSVNNVLNSVDNILKIRSHDTTKT